MKFNIDSSIYNGIFAVPTQIVDQYLKLASGPSLKVLLCLLRYSGIDIDIDLIEKETGLNHVQINDAFLFWQDIGILLEGASDFSIPNKAYSSHKTSLQSGEDNKKEEKNERINIKEIELKNKVKEEIIEEIYEEPRVQIISNSPKYPTQKEASERYNESDEIKFIVNGTQKYLNTAVTNSMMSSLIMLRDWADIDPDVILMSIHHCSSVKNIKSMQYIEKFILKLKEEGIDTHIKADKYFKEKSMIAEYEKKVKSIFGISGRSFSKKEQSYVGQWWSKYSFSIEIIKEAYERTIDTIGKLSFPYLDSILRDWSDKNIKSVLDIEKLDENFKAANTEDTKSTAKAKDKNMKTYDIDEMEKEDMFRIPKL